MKKIISLALFAFMMSFGAQSQTLYTVNFSGNVSDTLLNPISNLPITITVYDSMGTFVKTRNTTTNAIGDYFVPDSILSFNPVSQYDGFWIVSAMNCDSSLLADSNNFVAFTNSAPTTTIDLVYCMIPQQQPPCNAGFSYSNMSASTFSFVPNVFNGNWTYSWNFGDGNTSTVVSPAHTYASSVTSAVVTLTVSDGMSCTDVSNQTIYINITPSPNLINGIVTLQNMGIADQATVFLIEYDSTTGILVAVDSTQVSIQDSGWYSFSNMSTGSYLIKAALNSNSAHYSNYLPAYHQSSVTWSNATQVNVSPAIAQVVAPIELPAGVNPGGPGFIGGLVSQGANKRSGKELENVLVMLFDQNNNPLMYTYSDNDGKFEFSNLALGTYVVYTEVSGIPTNSLTIELTASKTEENRVRVEINSTYVETFIDTTTSVGRIKSNTSIQLYPNPVSTELNIVFTPTESNTKAHIVDVSGKTLVSTPLNNNGVNTLNTESLSPGMYLLRIESSTQSEIFKFVK